jgi:hypothetical protein
LVTGSATDLGTAGIDDTFGHGLVNAEAAYAALPVPLPDFTLMVTPPLVSVSAGSVATFEISVAELNGFTDDVLLSASGLPPGVAASIAPPTIVGGYGGAILSIQTEGATPAGSSRLTITASAGAVTHQTEVTLGVTPPPPPPDGLVFSTLGSVNPPGVSGTADDADIYRWSGSMFTREFDATVSGLFTGANVDGFDHLDATHFYVSFAASTTTVPGIGSVQDEDVLFNNAGVWSVWFDGTAHGLTSSEADIDAFSVNGSTLCFSTRGNVAPPGVMGTADDADIYRWNGSVYARAWDATSHGLPASTNVDGLTRVAGTTQRYLSFAPAQTTVPGLGVVQDEDVVKEESGVWSIYFDGTARSLGTSDSLDIDAFDLP